MFWRKFGGEKLNPTIWGIFHRPGHYRRLPHRALANKPLWLLTCGQGIDKLSKILKHWFSRKPFLFLGDLYTLHCKLVVYFIYLACIILLLSFVTVVKFIILLLYHCFSRLCCSGRYSSWESQCVHTHSGRVTVADKQVTLTL